MASAIKDGRIVDADADADALLELEVDEDGRLRLFCGRGSAVHEPYPGSQHRVTFESLIAGLTWRVLRSSAVVAEKTLCMGNRDLGVAVTIARAG